MTKETLGGTKKKKVEGDGEFRSEDRILERNPTKLNPSDPEDLPSDRVNRIVLKMTSRNKFLQKSKK